MQLNQPFTVLSGAIALALSLTVGIHALPTVPLESSMSLVRSVGQNGTHASGPVVDITRRAPELIHLDLMSTQISGQDIAFTTNIQLGRGKFPMPVRVDTGAATFWVISATCNERGSRPGYWSRAVVGRPWSIDFEGGSSAQGPLVGVDDVYIGRAKLPRFQFGLAAQLSGSLVTASADSGILPLANSRFARPKTDGPSVLKSLVDNGAIPEEVIGIRLGRPSFGVPSTGKLTLGGIDRTQFDMLSGNSVTTENINTDGLWEVMLSAVWLDYDRFASCNMAILDTGSQYISTTQSNADIIFRYIPNAVRRDGIGITIPCNTKKIISFEINRFKIAMRAEDFIGLPVPNLPGVCMSNIQVSNTLKPGRWNMGIPFLRNVYQILQAEHQLITLVQV